MAPRVIRRESLASDAAAPSLVAHSKEPEEAGTSAITSSACNEFRELFAELEVSIDDMCSDSEEESENCDAEPRHCTAASYVRSCEQQHRLHSTPSRAAAAGAAGVEHDDADSSASSSGGSSPSRAASTEGHDGDDEGRGLAQFQRKPSRGCNSANTMTACCHSGSRADRIRPGRWVTGEHIGRGSFGSVHKAMNTDTGVEFAVKEIFIAAVSRHEAGLEALTREIEVMRGLKHPNIVRYLGYEVAQTEAKLLIFQEWVPGNSLSSRLNTYGRFSNAMTRRYTGQVLAGLAYLHSNGVVHMDIKCENLLLGQGGVVKLADFGTAGSITDAARHGKLGSPLFMAPEVLLRRHYSPKADIWSLAGAVLQMTTLKAPWQGMAFRTPVQLARHMAQCNETPPETPENLLPSLKNFLRSCFAWAPENRPDAAALSEDPFITEDDSDRSGPESYRSDKESGDCSASSWEVLKAKILTDLQLSPAAASSTQHSSNGFSDSKASVRQARKLAKAASFHPAAASTDAARAADQIRTLSRRATVPPKLALATDCSSSAADNQAPSTHHSVSTAAAVTSDVTAAAAGPCFYGLEMKTGDSGSVSHNPFARRSSCSHIGSSSHSIGSSSHSSSKPKLAPLQLDKVPSFEHSYHKRSASATTPTAAAAVTLSEAQQQQQQHQHEPPFDSSSTTRGARNRSRRPTLDVLDLTSHQLQAMASHDAIVYAAATAAAAAEHAQHAEDVTIAVTASTVIATDCGTATDTTAAAATAAATSDDGNSSSCCYTAAAAAATGESPGLTSGASTGAVCCKKSTSPSYNSSASTSTCGASPASSAGYNSSCMNSPMSKGAEPLQPLQQQSICHSGPATNGRRTAWGAHSTWDSPNSMVNQFRSKSDSSSGNGLSTIRALIRLANNSKTPAVATPCSLSPTFSYSSSDNSSKCYHSSDAPTSPAANSTPTAAAAASSGRNSSGRMSSSLLRRVLYSRRVAAAAAASAAAAIDSKACSACAGTISCTASAATAAAATQCIRERTRSERGHRLVIPILDRNVVSESRLRIAVPLEGVEECHASCLTVAEDATL